MGIVFEFEEDAHSHLVLRFSIDMSEPVPRTAAEPQRFGRYELLLPLTDDGFVSTCIARVRGPTVGPRIAELARVAKGLSHEAEVRATFFAEARAAGRIRHVNFVHPTETLVHDGDLFRATEFVLGVRLQELLAAVRDANAAVPVGVACRIALDVLAGLSAVHATTLPGGAARPLVHGDVAPTNIVISYRGTSRLVHSGLSVVASRIGAIDRRNRRLAYKAPEQLRAGVRAVPIGPGADIFATGVILWEMLSGQRLFDAASDLETVERVLNAPVPPLQSPTGENIPAGIATLVSLALDRSPDRPTTSAADFGDALEQAAGDLLPGDEVVGLLLDRLLGPSIDRVRDRIQKRLDQAEASVDDGANLSVFGADLPPSSGILLERRKASSGRLRAQNLQPRNWSADTPGPLTPRTAAPATANLELEPSSHVSGADGQRKHPVRPSARLGLYLTIGAVIGLLVVLAWMFLPRFGLSPHWFGRNPTPYPSGPVGGE